ncbi:MAG: hypothetical protein WA771_06840 [Chthoniobacterales bacterium]
MTEDKIVQFEALRAKLAADFPTQRVAHAGSIRTGLSALDGAADGLPRGAVSEFSGSAGCASLFLGAFLAAARAEGCPSGLVDAGGTFEPGDWDPRLLQRLLWVVTTGERPALKAADLLLQDGNLPLLALDLQGLPERELRKIPASSWHRFQRVAERTETVFVVVTPRPMVEGARLRLIAESRWGLDAMHVPRLELVTRMTVRIVRKSVVVGPWRRSA